MFKVVLDMEYSVICDICYHDNLGHLQMQKCFQLQELRIDKCFKPRSIDPLTYLLLDVFHRNRHGQKSHHLVKYKRRTCQANIYAKPCSHFWFHPILRFLLYSHFYDKLLGYDIFWKDIEYLEFAIDISTWWIRRNPIWI